SNSVQGSNIPPLDNIITLSSSTINSQVPGESSSKNKYYYYILFLDMMMIVLVGVYYFLFASKK
ncbi:MAG: hypothetical protein ABIH92_03370, partial [Nanoarchaeota archaeon]